MKTVLAKSLDHVNMIACLLSDAYSTLGMEVPPRYHRLTVQKIANRCKREGYGFFTKSLPRLGKNLDKVLAGQGTFDCTGFRKIPGTKIPILFGNLFNRVLDSDGGVLLNPCVESIRSLRQVLYCFYKYELPYDKKLEQKAITSFVQAEEDVCEDVKFLKEKFDDRLRAELHPSNARPPGRPVQGYQATSEEVVHLRQARRLVHNLFAGFDVTGIVPRHGPGVVSTKEKYDQKYVFTRMNPRAQELFPFDKHMFINMDHLCDKLQQLEAVAVKESDAQVVLVPKDSRGPRVISCEPLENQWLQQGIMRAMVAWIETHPLTRKDIRFTDQEPNRMAALAGSLHGELATLDLKEASDRVSVWLVEQLFPEPLLGALLATRSLATKLPDGSRVSFNKFAPMGSACCFPVLATVVWALLRAGSAGADGKTVFVYGDDVIVETAEADRAIEQLETYGLHVNRDKSCTSGLFRESCGMDAYLGVNVTPVRFRTVWSSSPAADHYESWVAYANSLHHNGYQASANYIAECITAVYGGVPIEETRTKVKVRRGGCEVTIDEPQPLRYPALVFDPGGIPPSRMKFHEDYQKLMKRVRVVAPKKIRLDQDGWISLHRYFVERTNPKDETTYQVIADVLERVAQMSRESVDRICELSMGDTLAIPELAELADLEIGQNSYQGLTAYASSVTGVPLPVVHECLRMRVLSDIQRSRCQGRFDLHSTKLPELWEYSTQHTSTLKWAWR